MCALFHRAPCFHSNVPSEVESRRARSGSPFAAFIKLSLLSVIDVKCEVTTPARRSPRGARTHVTCDMCRAGDRLTPLTANGDM